MKKKKEKGEEGKEKGGREGEKKENDYSMINTKSIFFETSSKHLNNMDYQFFTKVCYQEREKNQSLRGVVTQQHFLLRLLCFHLPCISSLIPFLFLFLKCNYFYFFRDIYLLIWLPQVLAAVCRIFIVLLLMDHFFLKAKCNIRMPTL